MTMANVATALFCAGLIAQGWGLSQAFGYPVAAIVVGTEVGLVGLVGSFRAE